MKLVYSSLFSATRMQTTAEHLSAISDANLTALWQVMPVPQRRFASMYNERLLFSLLALLKPADSSPDVITRTLIANLLAERICLLVFLPHFARAPAANVFITPASKRERERERRGQVPRKIVSSTENSGFYSATDCGYLLVRSHRRLNNDAVSSSLLRFTSLRAPKRAEWEQRERKRGDPHGAIS